MTDTSGTDGSLAAGDSDAGTGAAAAAEAAAAPNWRDTLPEEIRTHAALADMKDQGVLAQNFIDLQGHMGNALRIPGPDAGAEDQAAFRARLREKVPSLMERPDPTNPEAMAAVYDAMGRPVDAAAYSRPTLEGSPAVDDGVDAIFADSAHRNGLSQSQYEGVYSDVIMGQLDQAAAKQTERQAAMGELRSEWGYTFEPRMTAIQAQMEKLGAPPPLLEALSANNISPDSAKFFHNVVEALGGKSSNEISGQGDGAATGMTPSEADAQIQEIMSKPEYRHHDYNVRKPWIDKVQVLMKFALPNAMHGDDAARDLKRSAGGSR